MKIQLKKVNAPDGTYWYGVWVDDSCQIPAYGTNLEAAKEAYNKIKEASKNPLPPYEIIQEETL